MHADKRKLRTRDKQWLASLAEKYRTKPMAFGSLLRRVDVVPLRLAIAQAVQESGWGTSRFARVGNALFGQHAPVSGNSIQAKGDPKVALQAFTTIHLSVLGYMQNLNRHSAYHDFRSMRASMRRSGAPLDPTLLVGSLSQYSEEGQLYVDRLRTVIYLPEVAAAKGAQFSEKQIVVR
jgi:Bax protein